MEGGLGRGVGRGVLMEVWPLGWGACHAGKLLSLHVTVPHAQLGPTTTQAGLGIYMYACVG